MAETKTSYVYVVLREIPSNDPQFPTCWIIVGQNIIAGTPLEAEKLMASKHGAGTYSAVSRWSPNPLRPKVTTTFEVGEPEETPAAPVESTVQA